MIGCLGREQRAVLLGAAFEQLPTLRRVTIESELPFVEPTHDVGRARQAVPSGTGHAPSGPFDDRSGREHLHDGVTTELGVGQREETEQRAPGRGLAQSTR